MDMPRHVEEYLHKVHTADKEGRLLILPVRMGETLWLVAGRREDSGGLVKMHHVQKSRLSWYNLPQVLEGYGEIYFNTRDEAEEALRAWRAKYEP